MVNKGVIYIGDVSGNLASITTSGQLKVDATVTATANISGQPVQISGQTVIANVVTNISGQTVYLPNNGTNNVVSISGQTVVGSFTASVSGQPVLISGQTVTVANNTTGVSGQTIYLVNDGVNNVAKISGQGVVIFDPVNVQPLGGSVFAVAIDQTNSANVVLISGQAIRISGQTMYLVDDSINNKIKISGQLVAVSGIVAVNSLPTVSISGNAVLISGQTVTVANPAVSTGVSGQTIYFVNDGVNNVVKISGQAVDAIIFGANGISPDVLGDTTVDDLPSNNSALVVAGMVYGYSPTNDWARLRTTASGDGFRLIVSISGQPVTASVTSNVSGNAVKVSGETLSVSGIVAVNSLPVISVSGNMVSISGQPVTANVTTNISGQVVYVENNGSQNISTYWANDGINNVVWISGQTVVASVSLGTTPTSGDASRISGQSIYIVNDSVNNVTKISGQHVSISGTVAVNSLPVISISGNMVSISGQPVTANVTTNVSGQTVIISGQFVQILGPVAVQNDFSTQWEVFTVSGLNNVQISGQTVSVSGAVAINNSLTIGTLPAISISGNMVSISGQPVVANVTTNVSGNTIYFVDNGVNNVVKISGQTVVANVVTNISGNHVSVSGIVAVNSLPVISVSGSTVSVSGIVSIGNAPTVLVSGGINVSGNTISISGIVRTAIPTAVRTRALLACTALSGGTQLLSGDVRKATVVNAGSAGTVMYIGSTTDPPFSGFGLYLSAGNGYTTETNNFNNIRAFAATSGGFISYIGEQF